MTDFGRKFAPALAMAAFGAVGFVSLFAGAQALTALVRALIAGVVFYFLGKLLALAVLYDPATVPGEQPPSGQGKKEEKPETEISA